MPFTVVSTRSRLRPSCAGVKHSFSSHCLVHQLLLDKLANEYICSVKSQALWKWASAHCHADTPAVWQPVVLWVLLACRVIGVSDLCDYPAEAAAKPKVSHSCFNSSDMTSAEVSTACRYAEEFADK